MKNEDELVSISCCAGTYLSSAVTPNDITLNLLGRWQLITFACQDWPVLRIKTIGIKPSSWLPRLSE